MLDLATGRNVGSIRLPRGPCDVAAVGTTAVIAGEVDATLTTVDPTRVRVTRTSTLPVTPFVLLAAGPDLFVGSIADQAVVRVDLSGRVLARADVPRFEGVLGVDRLLVTAGTYGDVASLVALRRGDLGAPRTTMVPDRVDAPAGSDGVTWAAFTRKSAVVSLP